MVVVGAEAVQEARCVHHEGNVVGALHRELDLARVNTGSAFRQAAVNNLYRPCLVPVIAEGPHRRAHALHVIVNRAVGLIHDVRGSLLDRGYHGVGDADLCRDAGGILPCRDIGDRRYRFLVQFRHRNETDILCAKRAHITKRTGEGHLVRLHAYTERVGQLIGRCIDNEHRDRLALLLQATNAKVVRFDNDTPT